MKESIQRVMQAYFQKIEQISGNKITLVFVSLFTIGEAALSVIDYHYYSKFPFDGNIILLTLLFLIIPSLFIETCFVERKAGFVCGYIIAFILSGAAAACMSLKPDAQIGGFGSEVIQNYCIEFLCGIFLILIALTFYKSFRKAEISFAEYAVKVFHNVMKCLLIYFILSFGAVFVCAIMEELLFDGYDMVSAIEMESATKILVFGFYLAPKLILALKDIDEEPGTVMQMIVKYILPVLTICGTFIVYLYMLKILLQWELPSNEVFRIVSALFVIGMPIWIMARYYDDESRYSYALSILPYVFAPLICLQLYSLGLRISQYGMTSSRYMGVMLIVFEVGMILIWRFRKTRCEILVPFFGILVFVSVFVPGINMSRLSNTWQMLFLKKYYTAVCDGEQLSKLAYERMTGAYQYLKNRPEMSSAITEYNIYEENFAAMIQMQEIDPKELTQYDTYKIYCTQMVGDLDISGYSKMSILNQNDCYSSLGKDEFDVDFSHFQFVIRETGENITADISEFAQNCMQYKEELPDASDEEISNAMKAYHRIEIDADTVLYLNFFEVRYHDGIKDGKPYFEWKKMNVGGILLQK